MIVAPSIETLDQLIRHQIRNLFMLDAAEEQVLEETLPEVLHKTEKCFSHSRNKYYKKDGDTFFSVYHSGQYCIFLYFLARQVFIEKPEHRNLADKIYYLNKTLNGLDLYYEVTMPPVFSRVISRWRKT